MVRLDVKLNSEVLNPKTKNKLLYIPIYNFHIVIERILEDVYKRQVHNEVALRSSEV